MDISPAFHQNSDGTLSLNVRSDYSTPIPITSGGTGGSTLTTGQLGLGIQNARLSTNYTNATTSLTDVTGLSFAIAASEIWTARFALKVNGADANGLKIAIAIPSGATILGMVNGNVATVTAYSSDIISASATAGIAFATSSATGSVIIVDLTVVNSTTAGTVQLQALKVTSGTATIYANSNMIANRVS
jgi:hypothetical protein